MSTNAARALGKSTCATHGEKPWNGEVVCKDCNRVFQTSDPDGEHYAPLWCPCGKPLMPPANREAFTARLCCSDCYFERMGKRSPIAPGIGIA